MVAHYAYDRGIARMAPNGAAKANPCRFSAKCSDDETPLYHYGFRFFSPGTGRWVSRDPIGERGGVGLGQFCQNDPIGRRDAKGMISVPAAPNVAAATWSVSLSPTSPNPRNVPDQNLDYAIDIDFQYGGDLPPGCDQTWLLTEFNVRYMTAECRWAQDIKIYVFDVVDYSTGGPVHDRDTTANNGGGPVHCLHYETVTKTAGFGSAEPVGPKRFLRGSEYADMKGRMVGPTLTTTLHYMYESPSKCPCCTLMLTGNYEMLDVPDIGVRAQGGW